MSYGSAILLDEVGHEIRLIEHTEEDPVIVDYTKKHDMEWAISTLPGGLGSMRRSWTVGTWGGLVVLLIYLIFCAADPYLERLGILPPKTVIVPELSNTFVVFLLAGIIALLFGSAAFYYQTSITAVKWIRQYVESCVDSMIEKLEPGDALDDGVEILKHQVHSMLLFAAQVPFRQQSNVLGHLDAMGVGNAVWAKWAKDHGVSDVIKASSGGVRKHFSSGCIAVVRRFGPRPGLIVANYLFFTVFLVLLGLTMRDEMYRDYLVHRCVLMTTLGYLMTMLLACANNTANPLRSLGGRGSSGLGERHKRCCVEMIGDAMREYQAACKKTNLRPKAEDLSDGDDEETVDFEPHTPPT